MKAAESNNQNLTDAVLDLMGDLLAQEGFKIEQALDNDYAPFMSAKKRRILTCLLAIQMPDEGVNELYEDALDCWKFYTEQLPKPTIPTEPPKTVTAKFVGYSERPGIEIEI